MLKSSNNMLPSSGVFGEGSRSFGIAEMDRVIGQSDLSMNRGKGSGASDNQSRGMR